MVIDALESIAASADEAVRTEAIGTVSAALQTELPVYRIAAGSYGHDVMDAAATEVVWIELGLDRPWWLQLWSRLGALATFDLGRSLVYGSRFVDEVAT